MAKKKIKATKKSEPSIYDEFEETSTEKLKKLKTEEEEYVQPRGGGDFLKIEDGENKFRIYPKRKNVDEAFYRMHSVWWLPFRKDNGDLTRTTVNNAKVHGNFEHDVVEEYVNLALSQFTSGDDEDNQKVEQISDWKSGIGNQITFMLYAAKVLNKKKKQFGMLEIKPSLKDDLMKECIIEDEDEAIELDPYTSPKTGKCAIISFDSKAKGAKKYAVRLSKFESPLTPEELKKFKLLPALYDHPLLKYTLKDFEKALECLEIFDEEYEIGIFDSEEFKRIVKKLRKEFGEISSDKKASKGNKKSSKKKVEEEDDEDDEEETDDDDDVPFDEDDDEEESESDEDGEEDESDDDEDDDDDEEEEDESDDDDDDDEEADDDDDEEEKPKKKSQISIKDIEKKLASKGKKKGKKK